MKTQSVSDRRAFLWKSGVVLTASFIGGIPSSLPAKEENKEKISPPEDLMREHGVLRRVLLIYEETIHRIDMGGDLPPETLAKAAKIVRDFVEDYHEKLEENYLFPRFKKAGMHEGLVDVLLQQHKVGRRLTDTTMQLALTGRRDPKDERLLINSMRLFIRMYNPHAAREDTVLFPAFRGIVTPGEFDALGEEFEKKEDKLFGKNGFFKVVDQVEEIEKKLDISDLSKFTPKL
jgi:hemerythrin-like domain-containing protein